MIKILTWYYYETDDLNDNSIKEKIIGSKFNSEYFYITATKGLEEKRQKIIPNHQNFNNEQDSKQKISLFSDLLKNLIREWLNFREKKLATYGEVKTIINRVAADYYQGDKIKIDNFKLDIKNWHECLYRLSARGINLNALNSNSKTKFYDDNLFKTAQEIQKRLKQALQDEGLLLFPDATKDYLKNFYSFDKKIIMEGFTYFTDIQNLFINELRDKEDIICITPYREVQKRGFSIIEETYKICDKKVDLNLPSGPIESKLDLTKQYLFSDNKYSCNDLSANIKMNSFPRREYEIKDCFNQLQEWFENGYKPKEVAIVMRNLADFQEKVEDIFRIKKLRYGENLDKEVRLYENPRLLLLTPIGKFFLVLYEVWENDELNIDCDQFETILNSGWLGPEFTDSISIFNALKNQFFLDCKTYSDWKNRLKYILSLLENQQYDLKNYFNRIPYYLIYKNKVRGKKFINSWLTLIEDLRSICDRLFSVGEKTIGEHIKRLKKEMYSLMPEEIRQEEKEILCKIEEVFDELEESHRITLTTSEFSEAINALTKEKEEDIEIKDGYLNIVTPEQIDNLNFKCIYYIGLDNHRIPRSSDTSWPLWEDNRQENIKTERYMFLSVIRSAKKKIVLSYAKQETDLDNGSDLEFEKCYYYKRVLELINEEIDKKGLIELNQCSDLNQSEISKRKNIETKNKQSANNKEEKENSEYNIDDLFHYGLCPRRFKIEQIDDFARVYKDKWQIQYIIQGYWLDKIFEYLVKENVYINSYNEMKEKFKNAREAVKGSVVRLFPGLSDVEWVNIENNVKKDINYRINNSHYYSLSFKEKKEFHVSLGEFIFFLFVPFTYRRGKYNYPEFKSKINLEWLMYYNKPEGYSNDKSKLYKKMNKLNKNNLFEFHYQAVRLWELFISALYHKNKKEEYTPEYYKENLVEMNLIKWVNSIKANNFFANRGKHCKLCSLCNECLNIEEDDVFV